MDGAALSLMVKCGTCNILNLNRVGFKLSFIYIYLHKESLSDSFSDVYVAIVQCELGADTLSHIVGPRPSSGAVPVLTFKFPGKVDP